MTAPRVLGGLGGLALFALIATLFVSAVRQLDHDVQAGTTDGHTGAQPPVAAAVPMDAEAAIVDRVVDGDTVRVIADPRGSIPGGGSIRVRLLNIDAPELARDDRPAECGARDAVAHMLELVAPGDVVWLVADEDDRDDFDRPLRGMWTDDGVFVNEAMAAAGWARDVVFAPNDRFFDVVAQAAATARADGRGMWEKCAG